MKSLAVHALALAATTSAYDPGSTYGGSGPYKSYYFEDTNLINHTLYQPLQSASGTDVLKLPVVIWGNSGCTHQGLEFRGLLGQIASYGALAIATGPAFTDPQTYHDSGNVTTLQNPQALAQAVDWVFANAGKDKYAHVDSSRIAVWGQSCGGLEAYTAGQDERIGHLGIFNSGQLDANDSVRVAGNITKPIFYFLGGPTDIAYKNGELDYSNLPDTTPAWKGNHDKGHLAAFDELNAGIPGVAGQHLMQWLLRGNETAKEWFVGDGWNATGFKDAVYQNLDDISVTPIQ